MVSAVLAHVEVIGGLRLPLFVPACYFPFVEELSLEHPRRNPVVLGQNWAWLKRADERIVISFVD